MIKGTVEQGRELMGKGEAMAAAAHTHFIQSSDFRMILEDNSRNWSISAY